MIWTPDQLSKLKGARTCTFAAARILQQVIDSVPSDTPGRDSLIAANEHLSGAEENIGEVLEHAQAAHEYTEALEGLAGENGCV